MTIDRGVAALEVMKAKADAMVIPETLGAFIAERAETLGDRPACVYFQQNITLTYRDLHEQADRLASSLTAEGVRKGAHVAVMLTTGPAFPVVWTALGRIGAVMVPVNTGYKSAELNFVLTNADAQFLIIQDELVDVYDAIADKPVLLSDRAPIVSGTPLDGARSLQTLIAEGDAEFVPPTPVSASDLLNIQYTSGTTGFPKGCMLTHRYWLLLSHSAMQIQESDDIRNVLMWQPSYYMDGQWPMLMAFARGGTVFIPSQMSLSRFMDWIRAYEIHYCAFPEALLSKLSPSPADGDNPLRFVNAFGWRGSAIREFEQRFGATARDAFGMTEIGLGTVMPAAASHKIDGSSCGLAGPFREMKVADDSGNEVPRNEPGELWVAGDSILWGYYKRPDANADSFRGRWFRTGDLARMDDEGYVHIVGRLKEMVKRSGENISAREVEAALREHDGIEEAAVVPVPDPVRREEVKAYLSLRDGLTSDDLPPDQVFAHCAERLAAFKLPRYIAYVETFPRTPTRKIAKQQLIADVKDLRDAAYDRVDAVWR